MRNTYDDVMTTTNETPLLAAAAPENSKKDCAKKTIATQLLPSDVLSVVAGFTPNSCLELAKLLTSDVTKLPIALEVEEKKIMQLLLFLLSEDQQITFNCLGKVITFSQNDFSRLDSPQSDYALQSNLALYCKEQAEQLEAMKKQYDCFSRLRGYFFFLCGLILAATAASGVYISCVSGSSTNFMGLIIASVLIDTFSMAMLFLLFDYLAARFVGGWPENYYINSKLTVEIKVNNDNAENPRVIKRNEKEFASGIVILENALSKLSFISTNNARVRAVADHAAIVNIEPYAQR